MSNSTRPGGYDERLVVPLEASRRGAHRARVSPLVAALPLLAVMAVVAAVIVVAYTLFLRPGTQSATDVAGTTPNPGATTAAPAGPVASVPSASAPAASASRPAASSSDGASPEPSTSAATGGTVDKATAFSVYNGSAPAVSGLASRGLATLKSAGFTTGTLKRSTAPVKVSRTTVYYGSESQAATAKAMVKELGVGVAKLSPTVAASGIVVVMANDAAA